MIVERKTFLIWRIAQLWIFFSIFVLEIIRASQQTTPYWVYPAGSQAGIWLSEGISFIIIGYTLAKFNHRWETGPFKEDIILDWILFTTWTLQIVLNTAPGSLSSCSLGGADPYNKATYDEQMRCYLFLGSTVLSFIALFTIIVTLILSIIRWKSRKLIPLSSCGYGIRHRHEKPYIVKQGLLVNGEPALFFYSKNTPPNSVNEKRASKLKNLFAKTTRTSPSPSPIAINISIPEPEVAATANHIKDIPDVTDDEKSENEKDNLVLKY